MLRWLPVLIQVVLLLYCLVEALQARPETVRNLPRWAWILLIVVLPIAGPLGWLIAGRPRRGAMFSATGGPKGPDDDPDFLRKLGEEGELRRRLQAHEDEPPAEGPGPRA